MAEFCEKCYRELFNQHAKLIMSEEPWLCEGCGEWTLVVELEDDSDDL